MTGTPAGPGFGYPHPMRVRGVAAAWALAIGLGGTAAAAGEVPDEPAPQPLWEVGLAGGAVSVQNYAGAAERELYWAVTPYVVYRGRYFRAAGRSVRLVLYERPRFWTDLSGGGWVPVDAGDNPVRAGMPDLDYTVQAGPRFNYLVRRGPRGTTILRLAVRGVWSVDGLNDISHRGAIAQPALRVGVLPEERDAPMSAAVTLSSLWGNGEHNGYFYDVPAAYATPQRPAYRSGAGLVWTAVGVTLGWRLTPDLRLHLSMNLRTLAGSVVEDSPLVTDRNPVSVGAGLVWVFLRSERTAVRRPAEAG
jgi:outer membrane protein